MRLIDADALRDITIRHRPSALADTEFANGLKQAVDYLVTDIDSSPTIECAACDEHRVELGRCETCGCGSNFQRRQP